MKPYKLLVFLACEKWAHEFCNSRPKNFIPVHKGCYVLSPEADDDLSKFKTTAMAAKFYFCCLEFANQPLSCLIPIEYEQDLKKAGVYVENLNLSDG